MYAAIEQATLMTGHYTLSIENDQWRGSYPNLGATDWAEFLPANQSRATSAMCGLVRS